MARLTCAHVRGSGMFHRGVGFSLILPWRRIFASAWPPLEKREGEDSIPDHIFELFPVLRRVGQRKGGVLSGGEQQQLAIARAMVSQPKLLILDEPTEGIQPSIVQQIEETLREIRTRLQVAILLVEQYLDFAWSIADRFYVMRRGHIVQEGNPRESDPASIHHLLSV